ncbi:MAG: hypothetical protein MRERV_90c001 [Mycoplasmataceae bacterium RV_VA103A]|nr:MAG: hypothetical protein MRERV_90c001 [Mycoplasmataceae bacterium RV_VA103A]
MCQPQVLPTHFKKIKKNASRIKQQITFSKNNR